MRAPIPWVGVCTPILPTDMAASLNVVINMTIRVGSLSMGTAISILANVAPQLHIIGNPAAGRESTKRKM